MEVNNSLFNSGFESVEFSGEAPAAEALGLSDLPSEVQARIFVQIARNGDLHARLVCREWNASILSCWNRYNYRQIKKLIVDIAARIDLESYPLTYRWLAGFYRVLRFRFDPELNTTPEEIERTYRMLQGEIMFSLKDLSNEERLGMREFLMGKLPDFIDENGEVDAYNNLRESINKGDFKIFYSMFAGCLFLLSEEQRGLAVRRACRVNNFLMIKELLENGPISDLHRDDAVMSSIDMRAIHLLLEKGNVSYDALTCAYNLAAAQGNIKVLTELPGQENFWCIVRIGAIIESTLNGQVNMVPTIAKQYISTLTWKHIPIIAICWLLLKP